MLNVSLNVDPWLFYGTNNSELNKLMKDHNELIKKLDSSSAFSLNQLSFLLHKTYLQADWVQFEMMLHTVSYASDEVLSQIIHWAFSKNEKEFVTKILNYTNDIEDRLDLCTLLKLTGASNASTNKPIKAKPKNKIDRAQENKDDFINKFPDESSKNNEIEGLDKRLYQACMLENVKTRSMKINYVLDKNQTSNNLSDLPSIEIDKLIKKLEDFLYLGLPDIKEETSKNELTCLLNEIHHYFDNPHKVAGAGYCGGLHHLQNHYGAKLLQIRCLLNNNRYLTNEEANVVRRGMIVGIQTYKINKAYSDISKGKKFIKAGLSQSGINPVKEQSKENIKALRLELKETEQSELREDELELFKVLRSLPYKLQHATNKYYLAMNQGSLDSYCEIQRRDPTFVSPFSTKGNVNKLGNNGFVFFRVYVDPINNTQTRYGDTDITFDINLLFNHGWISLHDQLKPFSTRGSVRYYEEKRLIRMAETCSIKNNTKDKSLDDGVRYRYRKTKIKNYDEGDIDVQDTFGKDIETIIIERSFLSEMFYGPDIIQGIALSVIMELRNLEKCGFRKHFLDKLNSSDLPNKIILLGSLIKDLFRIEGKYPVALRAYTKLNSRESQQFTHIGQRPNYNQIGQINNPDGDGRYNPDVTVNKHASGLALLKEDRKNTKEQLSILRRQKGKYTIEIKRITQQIMKIEEAAEKKSPKKDSTEVNNDFSKLPQLKDKLKTFKISLEARLKQISALLTHFEKTDQKLNENTEHRKKIIIGIGKICKIREDLFEKVDTSKLDIITDYFIELLRHDQYSIQNLIRLPNQHLILIADNYYEFILNDSISVEEIMKIDYQSLDSMSDYDLDIAFNTHQLNLFYLVKLYKTNVTKFEYATSSSDTLQQKGLELAPDVDKSIFKYGKQFGISIESFQSQLSIDERNIFNFNLKNHNDYSSGDEDGMHSDGSDGYDMGSDYDNSANSEDYGEENNVSDGGWNDTFFDMMDQIEKSGITSFFNQGSIIIDRLVALSYDNSYFDHHFESQQILNRKGFLKSLYSGFIPDYIMKVEKESLF